MKKLILITLLLTVQSVLSQKYFTRNGLTGFKASVAAFEPVQALNNSSTAIVTNDGKIAAQIFIAAFKFRVALMQEHFNENFMDSSTHPKATFNGNIMNFNLNDISGSKDVKIKGDLTIKGIKKQVETNATITKKSDNSFRLIADFKVSPKDFDIKIPSVIRRKIAREVTINIDYDLKEKK